MNLDEDTQRRFEAIYREHNARVFGACLRFASGDRAWAMDRAQEVFVKLAEHLHSLEDLDHLAAWLYRVSVTTCLVHLRRQRRWQVVQRVLDPVLGRTSPTPERMARRQRDASALEQALERLTPKQRTVVTLMYLDGKNQAEVGQILKLSKAQISRLHQRAIDTLKHLDWEFDEL